MRHFKKNIFKELAVSLLLFTGFLFSASLMSAPASAFALPGLLGQAEGMGHGLGTAVGRLRLGPHPPGGWSSSPVGRVGCSPLTPQGGRLTGAGGGESLGSSLASRTRPGEGTGSLSVASGHEVLLLGLCWAWGGFCWGSSVPIALPGCWLLHFQV